MIHGPILSLEMTECSREWSAAGLPEQYSTPDSKSMVATAACVRTVLQRMLDSITIGVNLLFTCVLPS